MRDLAFAYFRPDQFPTHSGLVEQLLYSPRGGLREREESDRVGKLLGAWCRDGERGKLFDGASNVRIDGRVAHFELGQIPEHAVEMRAAANFLVANYGRQKLYRCREQYQRSRFLKKRLESWTFRAESK